MIATIDYLVEKSNSMIQNVNRLRLTTVVLKNYYIYRDKIVQNLN
jgi:hypothetical protein